MLAALHAVDDAADAVRLPRGRPARRHRHAPPAGRPGGVLRVGPRGHQRAAHRADLRLARRALPRRRGRPPASAGATPASATCSTTASARRRPRLGDGRARPARGRPGVVRLPAHASSRTSPGCSACPGCPTSCASTTAPPPTSGSSGPHAAAPHWYTVYAALRYAIVSIRTTKRRVHFEGIDFPDDPDDAHHAPGRARVEAPRGATAAAARRRSRRRSRSR